MKDDHVDPDTAPACQYRHSVLKLIGIGTVKKLPDDPEWERVEARLARHAGSKLPEPT